MAINKTEILDKLAWCTSISYTDTPAMGDRAYADFNKEAAAKVLAPLFALQAELECVRGLLQRISERYKSPEGTDVAEIMKLIKGAESADIGKLDTADKKDWAFVQKILLDVCNQTGATYLPILQKASGFVGTEKDAHDLIAEALRRYAVNRCPELIPVLKKELRGKKD